ncbi:DUF3499 domain-containing protein [Trueperella pecoris]|uniref:DUF3499 domain-containing protein n=1 Tax=Trueperella pecoris TaxID=2733571 RepID=A0A7M1QYS1_9ACTO|nr:DUF3499 domain-containing protein [Trueperella pecoris]QOQ38328.1 DUF3499 domain-containing protein [Trueperella pecoris]QOR45186.1 DUF3499 domain-containing protein [Trueperella pecoris]QOR47232.1 DUF3499 domain-containing protein [Trueperella pecoris]QTG75091.1 DUF3499 domain-containing protein [Trueperella pecoris]
MSPIRKCSRVGCAQPAVATMTYGYREATAVIGPLSPVPQQGAFDLCKDHANHVTVPVGWQMIRLQTEFEDAPPSTDDLLALADAIREASKRDVPPPQPAQREVHRPAADVRGHGPARPRTRPRFTVIDGGEED